MTLYGQVLQITGCVLIMVTAVALTWRVARAAQRRQLCQARARAARAEHALRQEQAARHRLFAQVDRAQAAEAGTVLMHGMTPRGVGHL
jgi:ABC-type nickel/cobalt efflux system permease component RcnA